MVIRAMCYTEIGSISQEKICAITEELFSYSVWINLFPL